MVAVSIVIPSEVEESSEALPLDPVAALKMTRCGSFFFILLNFILNSGLVNLVIFLIFEVIGLINKRSLKTAFASKAFKLVYKLMEHLEGDIRGLKGF